MMELVVNGVSTRKVTRITEELCGATFSKSTVSQLCTALDARVRAFNERRLGAFPFVLVDAMYLKARDGEVVASKAALIVSGVNAEGNREVLGVRIGDSESEAFANLLLDEAENPMAIAVELGEPRRKEGGKYLLPVLVKIPIASLTLLPESDHHVARLSLVFVAQDDRGTSDPVLFSLPISIPNSQLLTALSQSAGYSAELAVRQGEQKLAIGVRDEIAELDSTLNVVASVGRAADGAR